MPGRGTHSGRGAPCVHNFRQNWLQLSSNIIYTRHGPGMCPAKAPFDTFWFNLAPSGVRLGALGVPFRALGAVRNSFLVTLWLHFVTHWLHFGDGVLTVSWRCRDGVVTVRLCKCYGGMKSHWAPIVWVFCISKAFPNSFFDTPLQRNDDFHIEL